MSDTMVSRSLRIKPTTLKRLEALAKDNNMGITVYIRSVLEHHVAPSVTLANLPEAPAGSTLF